MRPAVVLLTAFLALALPAGAAALPGDPQIVALTPGNGEVVAANDDGIPVTFECPAYTIAVYSSGDVTITDRGDYSDYDVRFSSGSAVGPDGRLAEQPYGSDAGPALGADGRTCTAELDTYDSASSPEIVGGRVFWQAYRYCNGCAQGYEVGPVRSFVVRPSVKASLRAPRRLYGGYLNVFTLESEAELSGAQVLLQRRAGKRWKTVVKAPFGLERTQLIAALPPGSQRLRVRIVAGGASFDVVKRTLTVRRGGRRATSARDDGPYSAAQPPSNSTLKFRVGGAGKTLRAFKASLTVFCVGPTLPDNRLVVAYALLRSARIAPDGSVTGLLQLKSGARVLLTGRLRNGRLKGEVTMSFSTCAGTRKLNAVRR